MALLTPSRRPAAVAEDPVPRTLPQRRRGTGSRNQFTAWLFLVPALLVFGLFAWWPIVRSLLLSFQKTNLVEPAVWVGLDNFRTL
ncbi:sugar ABC transporter permease, partial [Streptomyces sp. NPDC088178]